MEAHNADQNVLDPETRAFYCETLNTLNAARMPFLVGGAYAFERYTGIARHTKDFDIFVRRDDCERVLAVLADAGYKTELTFPHWLGKAYQGEHFTDIIFSAANGIAEVDDLWFDHAVEDEVLGIPARLIPAEEMIWSKGFVMDRERYDGADVVHILRARGPDLDWRRLLQRFDRHWRVLLSHLILFGFVYPAERERVPDHVMRGLINRLQHEIATTPPAGQLCQGTLLTRAQYLIDIEQWGYRDARLEPIGNMTPEETAQWTEAIEDEE